MLEALEDIKSPDTCPKTMILTLLQPINITFAGVAKF